jgi:predicted GNAT family acetyltransferase
MSEPVVTHVPESSRYELRLEGELIGRADYRRDEERILFTHTEVDPALQGRGYGGRLVGFAVEDARGQGLEIVPVCPFVADFIKQHPEPA